MTIEATKVELTEEDTDDVRQRNPHKFWRTRRVTIGPVPAEQNFANVVLALSPVATPEDHAALITAIEGVTGVQKALVTVYGQVPTADKIPADHDLYMGVECNYEFRPQPEP